MTMGSTFFPRAILFLCGLVLFASHGRAATLVSDPDPTGAADKCVYQDGTSAAVETPVSITPPAVAGACAIPLNGLSNGNHTLQVWFRSTVWGVDSQKVPFVFTKPAAGGPGPTNLKIVP